MFNRSVIFDTNAYRYFTSGKDFNTCMVDMMQIKLKEEQKEINAFVSPVVLMELFAHLSDTTDPHYENCKNAAAVAYLHSQVKDSEDYRLLADPESLLVKLMFNEEIAGQRENCHYLGTLAYNIYKNPDEKYIDNFRENFKLISAHVRQSEDNFIAATYRYIVLHNNPNAIDWSGIKDNKQLRKDFLARVNSDDFLLEGAKLQVLKACISAGVDPSLINDWKDRAKAIMDVFPSPLYLNREIMRRIAISGCDLNSVKKKRGNWLWDILILHNCAKNSTFNDKEALLVTSDGDMIDAANSAGLNDKVMRFDDYIAKLN